MSKSRSYFFTLNNPESSAEQMEQLLELLEPKAYIFQLEKGESGTLHYQGAVYVKNPIVQPRWLDKRIHWQVTKSWVKAVKYCGKVETRVAGPWYKGVEPPSSIQVITVLRPWQVLVVQELRQPASDRKILWLWEEEGNIGKTALAKYICTHFKAIYLNGKGSDAKYAVASFVKNKRLDVVVFGYPRSASEYVSYGCIEEIKDGIFFSSKYESGMVMYDSPHVVVFSNMPPDTEKMSKDRWDVRNIRTMGQPALLEQLPGEFDVAWLEAYLEA